MSSRSSRSGASEPRYDVLAELGFGRCSLKIAAPEAFALRRAASRSPERASRPPIRGCSGASSKSRASPPTVVKMNGAVELAPRLQIANFVCDLVSTGATLEANGLKPVETVLESQAVLIRTRKPLDETRSSIAEQLLSRIEGVLATKESKYIMLNASEEALDRITALAAGAEAPTIIPLHGRPGPFRGPRRLPGIGVLGDAAEAQGRRRIGDPRRPHRKDDDVKTLVWSELDADGRRAALARPVQRARCRSCRRTCARSSMRCAIGGWDALCAIARRIDGEEPREDRGRADRRRRRGRRLPEQVEAIELAASNIRAFHEASRPTDVAMETMPGLTVTQGRGGRSIASDSTFPGAGRRSFRRC